MRKKSALRNYQLRTIDYIKRKQKVMLMLDMGLGKTVSTLTALSDLYDECAIERVLIIAPLRVANTVWKQECAEWEHLQHLEKHFGIATGSEKNRIDVLRQKHRFTTINRESVPWLIAHLGRRWDFDVVIIDESSSFKQRTSKRFLALQRMINAIGDRITVRATLTGTPAPQGLDDIWTQYFILDQGERLGRTQESFRNRWFVKTGHMGKSYAPASEQCEDEIISKVADITLVMESEDYLELPPLVMNFVNIELPTKAMAQYKNMKKNNFIDLEDETIAAFSATSVVGKLQQISNGAVYHEEDELLEEGLRRYTVIHDEKLKALESLVEDYPDATWMVAYAFKHDLDRLLKAFPYAEVMDKEGSQIPDWNARKIKMLLVHPASAGHGLNLQRGGNQLVFFGLTWSLELYLQIIKRLYRSGQLEANVVITFIVMGDKDSIDHQMIDKLNKKAAVQDKIFKRLKDVL